MKYHHSRTYQGVFGAASPNYRETLRQKYWAQETAKHERYLAYRREQDPLYDEKQNLLREMDAWWKENRLRAVNLVGQETVLAVHRWILANEYRDDIIPGSSIPVPTDTEFEQIERLYQFAAYLDSVEDYTDYTQFLQSLEEIPFLDCQLKIIKDDIAQAQEQGDTQKAHDLRQLFVRYVQRPELNQAVA